MTGLLPDPELLAGLLASWLLLFGAALVSQKSGLGLTRRMLYASLRGLLQLLVLAYLLHFVFEIEQPLAQAAIILFFCVLAGHTSAGHFDGSRKAWLAAIAGLAAAAAVSLPWLAFTGAIDNESRALIPLGSMVVANGMNAVSLMFDRLRHGNLFTGSLQAALIPPIDTLRVVGLVHMPGIFVGMVLAGAPALSAASAQLVVLYMIVASSFTACIVSHLMLTRMRVI